MSIEKVLTSHLIHFQKYFSRSCFILMIMCLKEEGQQLSDRRVSIDFAVVKIVKLIYEPFAQVL